MVASCPSNAGGIGGRWRSATEEDGLGINEIARNYYTGGTNVLNLCLTLKSMNRLITIYEDCLLV